jgi:predicted HTH transcriptional regulator|tara:strand:- start:390 stop:962 length:573 start_codon:yes stop_codon:yes gene_type:complete
MIIDIPDTGIMLVAVLAFLSGIVTLYLYNKTRTVGVSEKIAPTNLERIDYYEKEMIDMKIRLDAMELDGEEYTKPDLPTKKVKSFDVPEVKEPEFDVPKPKAAARVPNMSFEKSVTFVLEKITEGPMTSRDIEVTLGKSREHVSRLMKKLFEDNLVGRDTSTRPYRYTITEKGRERIGSGEGGVVYAVSQ